jgi:transcription elongation factor Elf1
MFCPSCGDFRDTATRIDIISRPDVFRCYVCGHTFKYQHCPLLEKKYGPGTNNYYMDGDGRVNTHISMTD